MKIDILCRDGSPLGVGPLTLRGDDPKQIGVGGAEYALITMCETWAKKGYDVRLYNDPRNPSETFEQLPVSKFEPLDDRDVLIVFRSPNPRALTAKGLRVWWSCDQYTIDNFATFAPYVERIAVISPAHKEYFRRIYGINNAEVIDLPVRVDEYQIPHEKVPYRMLWSSVPYRGLDVLHAVWPLIKRDLPEASLVITSDYRLWGHSDAGNMDHKMRWMDHLKDGSVEFKGALNRKQLVQEQLKAELQPYTCTYEELFCISVAESQVAGVIPVTTDIGSLPTTNMGYVMNGNPQSPEWVEKYVAKVIELLKSPDKELLQHRLSDMAWNRFAPQIVAKKWDELLCG